MTGVLHAARISTVEVIVNVALLSTSSRSLVDRAPSGVREVMGSIPVVFDSTSVSC